MVNGIGFDLNIKYAANKKGTIYPYFSAGFVHLQNDDADYSYIDSNAITYGYPLKGSSVYNSTPGTSLLIIRSIQFGLGIHYYFSSRHTVLPFAGAELNYNYIWGLYEQHPRVVLGNAGTEKTTFNINSTTRIGIGLDAGIDYRISKELGFIFGVKYKIANLIGKKSEATKTASEKPDDLNSMNLLDKAATELNTNLNSDRTLSYLQFCLGFSVFLGKVNK